MVNQLKNYPEILAKYKISEEKDFTNIMKQLKEELEKKIRQTSKLQEQYKQVNTWILTNISQLESIEKRDKTVGILGDAVLIAHTILSRVHERTDIQKIVEDLAERIEANVRDAYGRIFPEDESFSFEHSGKGQFLSTINNEPITHPSGSQRAAISVGIMLSLAETFDLPMVLDEAFDRIDANRLKFFCEYITALAGPPNGHQICLVGYTSFNVEKNPDVLSFINVWRTYMVERSEVLEKNIKPLQGFPLGEEIL